jgi:hypothetical protein
MKPRLIIFAAGLLFCHAAVADQLHDLAYTLGEILASEKVCSIPVDQEKLKVLLRARVPADDLRFMRNVDNMVVLFPDRLADMTVSMKALHCEQMGRLARSLDIVRG